GDPRWRRGIRRAAILIAAPLFVASCVAQHAGTFESTRRILWPLCVAVVFAAAVGEASEATGVVRRLLAGRPIVRFGRISYGTYLFHPFVTYGVVQWLG